MNWGETGISTPENKSIFQHLENLPIIRPIKITHRSTFVKIMEWRPESAKDVTGFGGEFPSIVTGMFSYFAKLIPKTF